MENRPQPKPMSLDSVMSLELLVRNPETQKLETIIHKNCTGYNFEMPNFAVIKLKGKWSEKHKDSDFIRNFVFYPVKDVLSIKVEDRIVFKSHEERAQFIKGMLQGDIKE